MLTVHFRVLLRVRLLYYLKQEVIGRQADKIFSGAYAGQVEFCDALITSIAV